MAVELGAFADFLGSDTQFAVLFDTREDVVNHKSGLIVEHRALDKKAAPSETAYYVIPDVVERAATLRQRRLDEFHTKKDDDADNDDGTRDFVGDYIEPISDTAPNRWLATLEPVIVVRQGGKPVDTGWAVLVQERYDRATTPVTKLHHDLIVLGLIGLGLVTLVVGGLWGFVVVVLNENTRAKVTRLLRRFAGLNPERSGYSLTPSRSARSSVPDPGPTAAYDDKSSGPEWTKKTDRVEPGK
jgi:hypothetical protein